MKGWISSHQVTLTPWHATVWGIAFDQFFVYNHKQISNNSQFQLC